MRGFARHAEELGYESLVLPEHPLVIGSYQSRYPYGRSGRMPLANDCPVPDPLDLLAFIAACTTTLGLSTGVLILPAHHPVLLAKRLATIDVLSGGRVRLGIGVGWMREELEACGTQFESRGRRTDESIDVLEFRRRRCFVRRRVLQLRKCALLPEARSSRRYPDPRRGPYVGVGEKGGSSR
jgi:alkanesulfonate monooxygenase SsuD/methylene tetrahydromethanopterin reductase-like flavin-dependent oxidoreductase (luciferase family)